MKIIAAILVLALTRAEILQRMRAPVIRQADGLVKVYAHCPEDMRREYQQPIARFAADTVSSLYSSLAMRPVRFDRALINLYVGDVRTNDTSVISRVRETSSGRLTDIYIFSPGYADLTRLRMEIVKAFFRAVKNEDVDDVAARQAYRRADPRLRVADGRAALERWLAGKPPEEGDSRDDEEYLALMRKVLEPGRASSRDVLVFASRLFLYPRTFGTPFLGRFHCVSFREAVKLAKDDRAIRLAAYAKSGEMIVFGGGRGEKMAEASRMYWKFLLDLSAYTKSEDELGRLLDEADAKLCEALEESQKTDKTK